MSSVEDQDSLYQDDMSQVSDWGDNAAPDHWYHVRVDKVKTHDAEGKQMLSKSSNEPICQLNLKIQDEGPFTGKVIVVQPSLQKHALFQLKAFYTAAGYTPSPGTGHNPHKILNAEMYVKPTEETFEGTKRLKVAPFNVKPISGGRPVK